MNRPVCYRQKRSSSTSSNILIYEPKHATCSMHFVLKQYEALRLIVVCIYNYLFHISCTNSFVTNLNSRIVLQ